ncbi:MFS transporter [Segetibacter koreensis]|uniref:MFS transporter n=1 Tax=Segetibacter koreensis TaxID=398037 RepID=UPI0003683CE2|nr:MFS transporter [Segetibacter koreensis]
MKNAVTDLKPTRIRFRILAFIFISVVINYMDRSNISVAASAISNELHLTSVQLGLIFSAFGWTYAALQIPGGILVDRFGPRLLYSLSLILWSAATLLQGIMKGFAGLFGFRLAIGAFEAPAYPANNRIVTSWFPDNERASAIAVYTSGQFLGLAFLTPALAAIEHFAGWRGLFIITGSIGIIWGLIWYFVYRDPIKHSATNKAELDYIEKGGGLINRAAAKNSGASPFAWHNLREVFIHRKLWGIYIGQFAVNSTLWFFLTWFPTYLVKYRGLNLLTSGFLASVPFLAAFAGLLLSGFLSDFLIKKRVSVGIARKSPVIIGLLLSVSIVGANYVNSTALIIFFMTVAFFGNGFASITWVFVSTLAPKHLIGLTGGVFNFIGGLASIIVPIVIGFLSRGGSFTRSLIFIAVVAFIGACSYIFLVGKVERIEPEQEKAS